MDDPTSFKAFYHALLFFISLYVVGDIICGRLLYMVPPLVGHITVGIIFGPYVLDIIPSSWITLGNLGLALLLCHAGINTDVNILRVIGPRSFLMAIVGTILPVGIGIILALVILRLPVRAAVAVGVSFGPTSAGIALNVLEQCGVLHGRIGQLVILIALIDDIIALLILSQLPAITGKFTVTVRSVVVPITSAALWFALLGWLALSVVPRIILRVEKFERRIANHIRERFSIGEDIEEIETDRDPTQDFYDEDLPPYTIQKMKRKKGSHIWHVLFLLVAILPATNYSEVTYFLGAFLVGLCACQLEGAYREFSHHLRPVTKGLMRLFFGCTLGFTIPVTLFWDRTVILQGLCLSLAMLGKIVTGVLLTPTFENKRYDRQHWRDCAIVGYSMAGEAGFAFLLAQFGYNNNLFSRSIYASIVLAILGSSLISPILLRCSLALYPPPPKIASANFTNVNPDYSNGAITLDDPIEANSARPLASSVRFHRIVVTGISPDPPGYPNLLTGYYPDPPGYYPVDEVSQRDDKDLENSISIHTMEGNYDQMLALSEVGDARTSMSERVADPCDGASQLVVPLGDDSVDSTPSQTLAKENGSSSDIVLDGNSPRTVRVMDDFPSVVLTPNQLHGVNSRAVPICEDEEKSLTLHRGITSELANGQLDDGIQVDTSVSEDVQQLNGSHSLPIPVGEDSKRSIPFHQNETKRYIASQPDEFITPDITSVGGEVESAEPLHQENVRKSTAGQLGVSLGEGVPMLPTPNVNESQYPSSKNLSHEASPQTVIVVEEWTTRDPIVETKSKPAQLHGFRPVAIPVGQDFEKSITSHHGIAKEYSAQLEEGTRVNNSVGKGIDTFVPMRSEIRPDPLDGSTLRATTQGVVLTSSRQRDNELTHDQWEETNPLPSPLAEDASNIAPLHSTVASDATHDQLEVVKTLAIHFSEDMSSSLPLQNELSSENANGPSEAVCPVTYTIVEPVIASTSRSGERVEI